MQCETLKDVFFLFFFGGHQVQDNTEPKRYIVRGKNVTHMQRVLTKVCCIMPDDQLLLCGLSLRV